MILMSCPIRETPAVAKESLKSMILIAWKYIMWKRKMKTYTFLKQEIIYFFLDNTTEISIH